MKRWTTILAAALVASTPAWAQQTGSNLQNDTTMNREQTNPSSESVAENSGLTITGQVMEVNETSLRVQSMTGSETIVITPETTGATGLEVGDQVAVDFTRSSDGVMIATQVRPAAAGSGSATTGQSGAMNDQHAGHSGSTAGTTGTTGATGATGTMGATGSTTGTMGSTTGSTGSTASTLNDEDDTDMAADQGTTGSTTRTYGSDTAQDDDVAGTATSDQTTGTTGAFAGDDDTTLPGTASKLPLVALAGLLALGGAAILRFRG